MDKFTPIEDATIQPEVIHSAFICNECRKHFKSESSVKFIDGSCLCKQCQKRAAFFDDVLRKLSCLEVSK